MGMTRKILSTVRRAAWAGLAASLSLVFATERAEAQEILLTGPLAGAASVRKQKLYRENRFEIAPTVSFSLLDEYQRQIYVGLRLNYNLTDWIALGAWGAGSFGPLKIDTQLADDIQGVNAARQTDSRNRLGQGQGPALASQLTADNICQTEYAYVNGRAQTQSCPGFTKQLGTIDWIVAPEVTLVPFRGKIALFQSIYADTDLYVFGGPAFVGVTERGDCNSGSAGGLGCRGAASFATASRVAIAPTFGLGLSFYVNKWNAFGLEWRGLPFSRNTGGFDNHGGGPDNKFPDYKIDSNDREFKFNQMVTVSYGFFFPTMHHVSE